MFVGHYAASLALKKFEKRASLGVLFLAVQLVDILFLSWASGSGTTRLQLTYLRPRCCSGRCRYI